MFILLLIKFLDYLATMVVLQSEDARVLSSTISRVNSNF